MAPAQPQGPEHEDPLLTVHVEAALDPYRHRLPPDDLAGLRAILVHFYTTNPVAARALDELRAAPVVGRSGALSRRDDAALQALASRPRPKRSRGGSQ